MAPAWRRGRAQEAVSGRSSLHLAAMLVEGGRPLLQVLPSSADVDSEDDAGCTALHYAAEAGNEWAVELLLARGASVNAVDEHGSTPLAQVALHVAVAPASTGDRAPRLRLPSTVLKEASRTGSTARQRVARIRRIGRGSRPVPAYV